MWLDSQLSADLVTFTEEILNEKLYFLCSESTFSLHIIPRLRQGAKRLQCNLDFMNKSKEDLTLNTLNLHFYQTGA